MWHDNLKENLEIAVKEKRLNDTLISLSPSLSMKLVAFIKLRRNTDLILVVKFIFYFVLLLKLFLLFYILGHGVRCVKHMQIN